MQQIDDSVVRITFDLNKYPEISQISVQNIKNVKLIYTSIDENISTSLPIGAFIGAFLYDMMLSFYFRLFDERMYPIFNAKDYFAVPCITLTNGNYSLDKLEIYNRKGFKI